MSNISLLLVLIPAFPLAAAITTALLGPRLLKQYSHVPALIAIPSAFVLSLALLFTTQSAIEQQAAPEQVAGAAVGFEYVTQLWNWVTIPAATSGATLLAEQTAAATDAPALDFRIDVALRCDPLTVIMLCTVTFVSSMVVLFSIGYMDKDPGYWRYFSYVSLFVFSMCMLVSVSNFLLLYVFWEAVGVCSYLLIGFWFQKPEASAAGKKAFLVNRIGDAGLALGLFLIWTTYGTLSFHDVPVAEGSSQTAVAGVLGQARLAAGTDGYVGGTVGLLIGLCLLAGACGKSAQFPLHTWLPDAMEGPTPVSALIHAATMVTAGVYLIARCAPLYFISPTAQVAVATIGAGTALLAALIALTQTDLKRVLAYSTISQLGYMFLGLGTGTLLGITAGMFHLFTHAFFKALLFLGAGSVMHATGGVIDMRYFGGLGRLMPVTKWSFLFGAFALAGVVPFAGFFSKDLILAAAHDASEMRHFYFWLYAIGLFTTFLTGFYTFRAFCMTFAGEERVPEGAHPHEGGLVMTVPLIILAACALLSGIYFQWTGGFAEFLWHTPSLAMQPIAATMHGDITHMHIGVAALSLVLALAGVGSACFLYLGDDHALNIVRRIFRPVYPLSHQRFYIDEIYSLVVVTPLQLLAHGAALFDRIVIQNAVRYVGLAPRGLGAGFRLTQTGMVQFYALAMVGGLIVLAGTLLFWPAG